MVVLVGRERPDGERREVGRIMAALSRHGQGYD